MAQIEVNELFDGPTVDFYYTATKQEYDSIASFFGALNAHALVALGFNVQHVKSLYIKTVGKLFLATVDSKENEKRFVMPISAVTDIVDIIERSESVPDAVYDFRTALRSFYPKGK